MVLKARTVGELPEEAGVDRGEKRPRPEPWHAFVVRQRGRPGRVGCGWGREED